MNAYVPATLMVTLLAVALGCLRPDPAAQSATREFERRYPEYIVRGCRAVTPQENVKIVLIDFDAPSNAKNHGRAELSLRKHNSNSWDIVGETVNMWKK